MTQAFSPTAILRNGLLRVLIPLSFTLTVYLYLYPIFSTCAFHLPPQSSAAGKTKTAFRETAQLHLDNLNKVSSTEIIPLAPFRLLALGDPQLEGDTSIPTDYLGVFPHAKSLWQHVSFQSSHSSLRHRVKQALHDVVDVLLEDTFNLAESIRKRIDLFGNDFYLAHIYRTVRWWTKPTHVAVLGDLVGSQWLNDKEFARRAERFWTRVFRGGEKVPDDVAAYPAEEYDLSGYLGYGRNESDGVWSRRIINVAGNHDIGYAGDITTDLTERFEKAFGKVNYELRFELPLPNGTDPKSLYDPETSPEATRLIPELRLVILNDMNLDTPALTSQLQDDTYAFINSVINTAAAVEFQGHYTIVLTHIPLSKPAGVCVDSPFFDFHGHDNTLKEQNQLSVDASKGFLEGILGMSASQSAAGQGKGRRGIILNGHDHEGCDTYHFINQTSAAEEKTWEVKRWRQANKENTVGQEGAPGVREITVRSMMGDFGGNAGLLSVWFDETNWEWKAEYATCPLGTQHLWWLVHILDLICVVGLVLLVVVTILNAVGVDVDGIIMRKPTAKTERKDQSEKKKEINGVVETPAKEVITIEQKEKILDKAKEASVF